MKTLKKILITTLIVLLLAAGVWIFFHFFWVFGTGVKAGELNQVVYKGWVENIRRASDNEWIQER